VEIDTVAVSRFKYQVERVDEAAMTKQRQTICKELATRLKNYVDK
jgi:hypothetical protein